MVHNSKPDRNAEIWEMSRAKVLQKDIAAHFGLSLGRLNKIIATMSGYVPRHKSVEDRNAEIIRLLGEKVSQPEVAKKFGMTQTAVAAVLARWRNKQEPDRKPLQSGPKPSVDRQAIIKTPESVAEDKRLIAEFLATKGAKQCPTVALEPTQAVLPHNPGIDAWLNRKTGWPASDGKTSPVRRKVGKAGASSMKSCRIGAVI